jgi:hypothetical protein
MYIPIWKQIKLSIHRKEQWDLNVYPIVCIHREIPNRSTRIFCIWKYGIQIGSWTIRKHIHSE